MQTLTNDIASLIITRNGSPINLFDMATNAYYSKGGYLDGSAIISNKRETDDDYKKRKEITPYRNYYRPCVDALWESAFAKSISREFQRTDLLLESFLADADAKGNDLDTFMRSVAQNTANNGMSLIMMDNFDSLSELELVNVQNRDLPYVYQVRADRLRVVFLDEIGSVYAICYSEEIELEDGNKETYYRIWTESESYLLEDMPTNFSELQANTKVDGSYREHFLGVVPCIFAYSYPNGDQTFIPSKFVGALLLNDMVYQQGSEVREYQRKLTFPILVAQGLLKTENKDGKSTYLVGSDKIMQLNGNAKNMPIWLSPAIDGLKELSLDMKEAIKELESISGKGEADSLSKSASEETRKLFFQITSTDKVQFAMQMEDVEQSIFRLFGLYTHQDTSYYGATIEYNKSLGLDSIQSSIDEYTMLKEFYSDSETMVKEIMKASLTKLLQGYTPKEIEAFKGAIDTDFLSNQETFNIAQGE